MKTSKTKRFIAILPGILGIMLLITYPSVSRISSSGSVSAAKIRMGITHKPIPIMYRNTECLITSLLKRQPSFQTSNDCTNPFHPPTPD